MRPDIGGTGKQRYTRTAGRRMGTTAEMQETAEKLLAAVRAQGEIVRNIKQASGGATMTASDKELLKVEVDKLTTLKKELAEVDKALEESRPLYTKCRAQLENLLKRRFFIAPSFEIYGGTGGLYDFGPPGCAFKAEVEGFWRRHFVLEDDMLELSGTCLTPHRVLKTSGHVDKFCDLLVRDVVTGDSYRADKLLEEVIDERLAATSGAPLTPEDIAKMKRTRAMADGFDAQAMHQIFTDMSIKSPNNNDLTAPFPFNLMFATKIGPKSDETASTEMATNSDAVGVAPGGANQNAGFLRPETAQGIFVNFKRLLDYNAGKMPFAAAQIGLGFRNEIAPRNGVLRTREFQMAEIEHFVHPDRKDHPKFELLKDLKLPLFTREKQTTDGKVIRDMTLADAVDKKIINNQTLAYFIGRAYLFFLGCGIQESGLRFRQHLATEMAHYACDCWDAEVEMSYGWVECAGIADRSAYDLTKHSEETGVELLASRRLDEPMKVEHLKVVLDKGAFNKSYPRKLQSVIELLEAKSMTERKEIDAKLEADGKIELKVCTGETYEIPRAMLKFDRSMKTVAEESFVPAVIEPSFGIGRVVYAALEHTFRSRNIEGQEQRCFLAFPPIVAPTKCSILPISANSAFDTLTSSIKTELTRLGVSCKVDNTGAQLGKRYARTDEIGIPFGITLDQKSLEDSTVTLRERDSMEQVRLNASEVAGVVADMVAARVSWTEVQKKFPAFAS